MGEMEETRQVYRAAVSFGHFCVVCSLFLPCRLLHCPQVASRGFMDWEWYLLPGAIWFCCDSCDCGFWCWLLSEERFMKPNKSLQATATALVS